MKRPGVSLMAMTALIGTLGETGRDAADGTHQRGFP
jgi:hypothetical protein